MKPVRISSLVASPTSTLNYHFAKTNHYLRQLLQRWPQDRIPRTFQLLESEIQALRSAISRLEYGLLSRDDVMGKSVPPVKIVVGELMAIGDTASDLRDLVMALMGDLAIGVIYTMDYIRDEDGVEIFLEHLRIHQSSLDIVVGMLRREENILPRLDEQDIKATISQLAMNQKKHEKYSAVSRSLGFVRSDYSNYSFDEEQLYSEVYERVLRQEREVESGWVIADEDMDTTAIDWTDVSDARTITGSDKRTTLKGRETSNLPGPSTSSGFEPQSTKPTDDSDEAWIDHGQNSREDEEGIGFGPEDDEDEQDYDFIEDFDSDKSYRHSFGKGDVSTGSGKGKRKEESSNAVQRREQTIEGQQSANSHTTAACESTLSSHSSDGSSSEPTLDPHSSNEQPQVTEESSNSTDATTHPENVPECDIDINNPENSASCLYSTDDEETPRLSAMSI